MRWRSTLNFGSEYEDGENGLELLDWAELGEGGNSNTTGGGAGAGTGSVS